MFELLLIAGGVVAGAIAAISGFGIGSVLTPLLTAEFDTRLAVALVAIPHFIGTALRLYRMRAHVDRPTFREFGLASALGGLLGALLHARIEVRGLELVFGLLLLLAALSELTGFWRRQKYGVVASQAGGFISGMFGGLVGNQGSIRSAALLRSNLERDAFVATATATALLVDLVRLPVYLANFGSALLQQPVVLATTSIGVVVGTLLGGRILQRLPLPVFRRIVAILLVLLGLYMVIGPR